MESSISWAWLISSTAGHPFWLEGTETTLLSVLRTTGIFSLAMRIRKNSKIRAWSLSIDKSSKTYHTYLISRTVYKRVITFCVWVRKPWTSTPGGQGRRPVPFCWHRCVPRDPWSWAVLWVVWAGRQGLQVKHTLKWPLLPLCTGEQRPRSFPAPEGGWTELEGSSVLLIPNGFTWPFTGQQLNAQLCSINLKLQSISNAQDHRSW